MTGKDRSFNQRIDLSLIFSTSKLLYRRRILNISIGNVWKCKERNTGNSLKEISLIIEKKIFGYLILRKTYRYLCYGKLSYITFILFHINLEKQKLNKLILSKSTIVPQNEIQTNNYQIKNFIVRLQFCKKEKCVLWCSGIMILFI